MEVCWHVTVIILVPIIVLSAGFVVCLRGHNECCANVKLALNSRAAPYRTERLSTKQTLNLKTTVYKTWHYLLRQQPDRAVPGIHLSITDAGSAQFYG